MKQFESEHYIFHYNSKTKAEQDISKIVSCQEACITYICNILNVTMPFKLQYFLCETPQEVGDLYNGEPCNGLAVYPDRIYAVYNNEIQCIGCHEDAHLISFIFYDPNPNSPAIEEGFAMYFDRQWWGINNFDWVKYYIKNGYFVSIDKLFDENLFYNIDCSISYPIMGAFTEWLITFGGLEKYSLFYRKRDQKVATIQIYGKTLEELSRDFVKDISVSQIDAAIEQQITSLIKNVD